MCFPLYQLDDVEFVKVDVEGYESLLVQGAKKFFANAKPRHVVMEVNHEQWERRSNMSHWMSFEDTADFFTGLGYKMVLLKEYETNPNAEAVTAEQVRSRGRPQTNPDVVFLL